MNKSLTYVYLEAGSNSQFVYLALRLYVALPLGILYQTLECYGITIE